MPTPMADTEARMGIQPVEELLAQRALLVRKAARLAAVYGPFGVWEARRKELLALCTLKIRDAELDRPEGERRRLTDKLLDAEAHAHPEYQAFLSRSVEEKASWLVLEDEIQGLNELVNRGQSVARYVTAELSLSPRGV